MAYDKSVFILGAGASVPAGAPVLNDFLKKARELLDNPICINLRTLCNCQQQLIGM
jgi:hypothetical protein